jgi:hypothetical protein
MRRDCKRRWERDQVAGERREGGWSVLEGLTFSSMTAPSLARCSSEEARRDVAVEEDGVVCALHEAIADDILVSR